MIKRDLALALCRVSSIEQLESNSLNRQREAILKAAEENGLTILSDDWWSGSVSSKKGKNIDRKDLQEMLDRCKHDRRIACIIVDEVDRFMRSMLEIGHFLVEFKRLDVKVIFASQPNLKTDTAVDTLLLMLEAFKAEGSNEERQNKSIRGQTKALADGRYPFSPKPGYRRGQEKGIQEVHEVRGPALRTVLIKLASNQLTPSEALIELNNSDFMRGHALYKMDKFRKIATDPFYAGIVTIDKQVKIRNENGLHEPLISKDQHEQICYTFNNKLKNQAGPRKNGNPEYPLNNIVSCDWCVNLKNGRIVGFDHSNGKYEKLYHKYRCRGCGRYQTRDDLHQQVTKHFRDTSISPEGLQDLTKALNVVWKQREGQAVQEASRVEHKIQSLKQLIDQKVDAATDPSNASIKDNILTQIERAKAEIASLEGTLNELRTTSNNDKERFLRFAFDFINQMGPRFLEISQADRLRCKQIVFPAGFRINKNGKVYTPEISLLYRVAAKKKSTEVLENSHLVRVRGL